MPNVAAQSATNPIPATVIEPGKPVISQAAQKQFDSAMALLRANQIAEAQQQLRLLTQTNPELAVPWINLGLIAMKANQFESALEYFKKALAVDAGSAMANNYLGMTYRNLGKFKEAEAAYQAAIAANAEYALAHFNLGVLYDLYLQQPEAAIQQYESYQSLQGTPDNKVAGWIKELKNRVGNRAKSPEAAS